MASVVSQYGRVHSEPFDEGLSEPLICADGVYCLWRGALDDMERGTDIMQEAAIHAAACGMADDVADKAGQDAGCGRRPVVRGLRGVGSSPRRAFATSPVRHSHRHCRHCHKLWHVGAAAGPRYFSTNDCVWRRGAGAVQGRTTSRSPLRSAWSMPDPSVGFRSGHVRVALLSASPGSRRRLIFDHAPPPSPR
eukprot:COSAG01_NODE_4903_length_4639_cov_3.876679_4_plen_193_part_00